jgi:diadenosine tetraphosphatase ApaH/serine/threonine PP2A family protein phosphatase
VRTLIVGDVHGCSGELERLLTRAAPERVVLVGDLFTKGPNPRGVWELIVAWDALAVLGNHDAYVLRRWADFRGQLPEACRLWLAELPLFLDVAGVLVVHAGLHPLDGRSGTTREMALSMRRFPDPDGPFWYDAGWAGPTTVVFGHDAVRGRVRREVDGQPVAIGLDSGCVYGGELTGWLVERDELIVEPAMRAYCAVT